MRNKCLEKCFIFSLLMFNWLWYSKLTVSLESFRTHRALFPVQNRKVLLCRRTENL